MRSTHRYIFTDCSSLSANSPLLSGISHCNTVVASDRPLRRSAGCCDDGSSQVLSCRPTSARKTGMTLGVFWFALEILLCLVRKWRFLVCSNVIILTLVWRERFSCFRISERRDRSLKSSSLGSRYDGLNWLRQWDIISDILWVIIAKICRMESALI